MRFSIPGSLGRAGEHPRVRAGSEVQTRAQKNLRTHSRKQVRVLARSMQEFGFTFPARIDSSLLSCALDAGCSYKKTDGERRYEDQAFKYAAGDWA
jgi:hypothetical protein